MFSWIIKDKAKIIWIDKWVFTVINIFKHKLNIWDSIAHDWACMTLTEIENEKYSFFFM